MPPVFLPETSESIFQSNLSIHAKLERARDELLDLSARNRLLHLPRSAKNTRTIEVVDEKTFEIFRLLVREGKTFTFLPGREASDDAGTEVKDGEHDEVLLLAQPDDAADERGVFTRHADTRLQTRLTSKGLQKRLLDLYVDAITLEQEQGVNILYLALGMLRWIDPKNATNVRHAPLLLIPVLLERATAGEKFKLKWRGEEFSSNLSLEALLDRVHGIRLPRFEMSEEFDPVGYMKAIGEAIQAKEGWGVLPDEMVVGFFSFAKFLMYRDLDPSCWPEDAVISQQPLVRALVAEGFANPRDLFAEDSDVDEILRPADMLHIVDCDSSQTLAVQEVRRGHNLIIQGPPGTGKSQTIANAIAAAVADGKTVLFVAEKMAALDVVKRRLDAAGVGDACLELHSNKANKRALLQELKRTWDQSSSRGAESDELAEVVLGKRDELNEHVRVMHEAHPIAAVTPFQVIGELVRLIRLGQPPTDFPLSSAATWTPADRQTREALVEELAARIEEIGLPSEHPWWGVRIQPLLPADTLRLQTRLKAVALHLYEGIGVFDELSRRLQQPAAETFEGVLQLERHAERVVNAPILQREAIGFAGWDDRKDEIDELLEQGQRFASLAKSIPELRSVSSALAADDEAIRQTQEVLRGTSLSAQQLKSAEDLKILIQKILAQAVLLNNLLQRDKDVTRTEDAELLAWLARQITNAPAFSAQAFLSPKWDTSLEEATAIVEALTQLETARVQTGTSFTDSAWEQDLSQARQILAEHGSNILRFFNGRWRLQNRLVRSLLTDPQLPLEQLLPALDALQRGRAALAQVERDKDLGAEMFGADWRGVKSSPSALLQLTTWMRELHRFVEADVRLAARQGAARRSGITQLKSAADLLERQLETMSELVASLGNCIQPGKTLTEWQEDLLPMAKAHSLLCEMFRTVPDTSSKQVSALEGVRALQGARKHVIQGEELGRNAFDELWKGELSDWETLSEIRQWITRNGDIRLLTAAIADRQSLADLSQSAGRLRNELAPELELQLEEIKFDHALLIKTGADGTSGYALRPLLLRLESWAQHIELLTKWTSYRDRADLARSLGLADLTTALENGTVSHDGVLPAFQMAYYEAVFANQVRFRPALAHFDGDMHRRKVEEFGRLDLRRIQEASQQVVRAHRQKIPTGSGMGPIGVLRGEMARKRGHKPIRQLMQLAAPAIQAIKPVMMMSPLSVAQFLPPGELQFDLLVMDEASQIQPVDALGAIARCKQMMVVGDERQLPPTRFFSKLTGSAVEDDEENEEEITQAGDTESVLALCAARGLPQRMLRWHYRSRHESLIAVSNSQFYENKLHIVPSPYMREAGSGLRFHFVPDGIYDSKAGSNAVEAARVAEAILRHASERPHLSLGVATFSIRQRKAIQDQVELLRRRNPDTERFFQAHASEPFFIKNLENVQGDERDVMFLSVGYGKNTDGFFAMRFGPLSTEGGERRLNVLISRAKHQCDVFSSITDEDIDLERARGKGVVAFQAFLHYARTGEMQIGRTVNQQLTRNVLAKEIAEALRSSGYQVHRDVGISGLFLDLAVADAAIPGRYVLGVECDGPNYRAAQSARDRDRIRPTVLADHGWRMHRIWSMDWLQRPNHELKKLIAAVEQSKQQMCA